jgi:hypothetical protein
MSNEWFYEVDGSRKGPVQPNELKSLADAGKIKPDTPVWREGMPQWAPAKAIRGLFAATATAAPPSPPPAAAPAQPSPRPRDLKRPDPLAFHPLDRLISITRNKLPQDGTALLSRIASRLGIISLYAACVLVPLTGVVLGIRQNRLAPIYVGLGVGVALLVLQFVAQRLLASLDNTITNNKTILSSLAVPDCVFVLAAAGSLALGLTLLFGPTASGRLSEAIFALCIWAIGCYVAAVAIQPESIGVTIRPECRAAEEAVGVVTFLLKIFLRAVPLAFVATVIAGIFKAMGLMFADMESPGSGFVFSANVGLAGSLLLGGAALPISAYLLTLAYYLTLDVISAIVSLPGKLDLLAETRQNGEG